MLVLMNQPDLTRFEKHSYTQWRENALSELKGADPDSLRWHFDPDIIVEPYYDASNSKSPGDSGLDSPLPGREYPVRQWHWHYLEQVTGTKCEAMNELALHALNTGATGIIWDVGSLKPPVGRQVLFKGIQFEHCQTVLKLQSWNRSTRQLLLELLRESTLPGWLYFDPVDAAESSEILNHSKTTGGFRSLCFDATSGRAVLLSPSDTLAFLLSKFVERARALIEWGHDIQTIAAHSIFCVTLGRDFFHQLASIRALRLLISQAASELGHTTMQPSQVCVYAEPSPGYFSVTDPYVNMIRNTAAATAALSAGANFISLPPFDLHHQLSGDAFRHRMSRNISALLKEESHLGECADPAAGSFYIDSLTMALASCAWQKMQEVEAMGGFARAVQNEHWDSKAEQFRLIEKTRIDTRKTTIIGVNNYCDLDLFKKFPGSNPGNNPHYATFEGLRLRMERHLTANPKKQRPAVQPVLLTQSSQSLARFRFIQGLLPAAGIRVNEPVWDLPDRQATAQEGFRLVFICGADEDYVHNECEAIAGLRTKLPDSFLAVAGHPGASEAALRAAGVNDFVHIKSDFPAVLSNYQKLFGIA